MGVSVPELLLQCLVLEPLVLRESKLEREAAGRAAIDFEAGDLECLEALGEDLRVGRLNEVLDLGRALFEDERPEMRYLGDKLATLLVQRALDGFGLADWE